MSFNYMYSGTNTHECDVAYYDGSNWNDIEDAIFFDGTNWVPMYQRNTGIDVSLNSSLDEVTITFNNGVALTGTPNLGVSIDKEYPTQVGVSINSANIVGNALVLSIANTYAVTDLLFLNYDDGIGDLLLDGSPVSLLKRLVIIT